MDSFGGCGKWGNRIPKVKCIEMTNNMDGAIGSDSVAQRETPSSSLMKASSYSYLGAIYGCRQWLGSLKMGLARSRCSITVGRPSNGAHLFPLQRGILKRLRGSALYMAGLEGVFHHHLLPGTSLRLAPSFNYL
eukprot:Gb_03398 [translate_table: standard]